MRVSDKEISASRGPVDILVALDSDSISSHSKELSAIGVVVL
jgi:Pyruvate/2-oxoacid:ferredoxin oxidoreductase gamma subunit